MISLALVLLSLAPQVESDLPAFERIPMEGEFASPLCGVWQSRGYGWLAEIRADGARLFDHGPAGTLEQIADPDDLLRGSYFRRLGPTLQLSGTPGSSTVYTWDPLPSLPASCDSPPSADPASVFDYFWTVMQEHYVYFEERGIDWQSRREEHRRRVNFETTEEELWEVLCDMLRGLNDAHTWLEGEVEGRERSFEDGECRELDPAQRAGFAAQDTISDFRAFRAAWFRSYRYNIIEGLLGGEYEVGAQDQVLWGRIGPLGYINLRGMGGFAPNDEFEEEVPGVHSLMSRVLDDLSDCEGIILDITMNSGGYDEVQMAISSHFTDQRRVGFRKVPLDADGVEPQPFYLYPAEGKRYLGPVRLVTSDYTVSAGEDFTLAMRELPHVTHVGVATRGAFSDILTKLLPNGWTLNLSNEAYLDVDGNNWEVKGVPPDEHVPIFTRDDLMYSHHDAILEIADRMIAESQGG